MKGTTWIAVWVCPDCDKVYRSYEVGKNDPQCSCKAQLKCTTMRKEEVETKTEQCRVDMLMRDNPRWSDAMGINVENPVSVAEAKRLFPDSTYDSEGRLLIRNRQHKLQEMSRRGYFD